MACKFEPVDVKPEDGGPAFPIPGYKGRMDGVDFYVKHTNGMTLRDWFAGMWASNHLDTLLFEYEADKAYKFADEMLKRRKQ